MYNEEGISTSIRVSCVKQLKKIYYNIITVLSATIIQHAAKSAEERRHSNDNMRAHLGEIYINSNNQSSFPNNNKS
jgi:hypothetical protein